MHLCKHFLLYFFPLQLLHFQSFACYLKHFLILFFGYVFFFLFLYLLSLNLLIQGKFGLLLLDFKLILFFFLNLLIQDITVSLDLPPFIFADIGGDFFILFSAANNNSCWVDIPVGINTTLVKLVEGEKRVILRLNIKWASHYFGLSLSVWSF